MIGTQEDDDIDDHAARNDEEHVDDSELVSCSQVLQIRVSSGTYAYLLSNFGFVIARM